MLWSKQGRVFSPNGQVWWATGGFAFNPTAQVRDDAIRVFFASLDAQKHGRIGYVDLDRADPRRIIAVSAEPVFDLGPLGAFDDSGVNPSCVLTVRDRTFLYYIGWQRCERVPYMLFGGLAVAEPGAPDFRRVSRTPVLDRTDGEPFSRSAPCVLVENGEFRAWYWSCDYWSTEGDWLHYNNSIRHARSADGIHWPGAGDACIAPAGDDEYAVGRPWVLKDDDAYRMWYSVRSRGSTSYRIGYAESPDGVRWVRRDAEVGIAPSAGGWDSEMICHPCVLDVGGRRLMFYNGNHHGQEGFGLAVLEHG